MWGSKEVRLTRPFLVTPEGLSRLVRGLPVARETLQFDMALSDGTKLRPKTVEEILQYPNPKSREIQTIGISSPYSDSPRCGVLFSMDVLGPVRYEVSGEDDFISSASDAIERHLETMVDGGRRFHSESMPVQVLGSPLLSLLGLSCIVIGVLGFRVVFVGHGAPAIGRFGSWLFATIGLFCFLLSFGYERILRYFFPQGSFAVGDGNTRYQRMTERRKNCAWGFLVALIVGVLAGVIANQL
jgi:hypothetical protein